MKQSLHHAAHHRVITAIVCLVTALWVISQYWGWW